MRLVSHRGIPQTLERNRHLGGPAIRHQRAGRIEQRIPRPITRIHPAIGPHPAAHPAATTAATHATGKPTGGQQRVGLDSIAVERKHIGPLLVQKRVKVNRNVVVTIGTTVTICPVRAHHTRVGVMGIHPEIQMRVVVGDIDLCILR